MTSDCFALFVLRFPTTGSSCSRARRHVLGITDRSATMVPTTPIIMRQTRPIRHTPDGPLVGTMQAEGRVEAFIGVPYAAPPLGKLRWAPPQPVEPWEEPRDVSAAAPACPQSLIYYPPVGPKDENCLFLNVFTAAGALPSDGKATMVYLHGGSFTNGGANEDRLNASFAVAQQPELVVVVVQYRLGILGFASGRALGGPTSGNYGIQDQRAALQWVQRSIHAFGGDRARVLLAGQSAGAGSVSVHLVATRSVGLFSRALMLSGAVRQLVSIASPCVPRPCLGCCC